MRTNGSDRRLDRSRVTEWIERLEAQDPHAVGHSTGVAAHARRLAQAVGCSGELVESIELAALLHDVGKIEVPARILAKPGPLDAIEWDEVRRHPAAGERVVEGLGLPAALCAMVRAHHERWDGSGYPDGLAGEAIPLGARILTVADVFDALTTDRAYRPAMGLAEALEQMRREAGTVLDPELFSRFEELLSRSPAAVIAGVGRARRTVRPG